jgi:hypothetical protein
MNNNNDSLQDILKNKINYKNLICIITIKVLNFFGYKYTIPKVPKVPKNHLNKYIEYQIYLKNKKELLNQQKIIILNKTKVI